MSMKQLETFMSRVQSNDNIRAEVQRCGEDNFRGSIGATFARVGACKVW